LRTPIAHGGAILLILALAWQGARAILDKQGRSQSTMAASREPASRSMTEILRIVAAFGMAISGLILLTRFPLRHWLESGTALQWLNRLSQPPGPPWIRDSSTVLVVVLFLACWIAAWLGITIAVRMFKQHRLDAAFLRVAAVGVVWVPILSLRTPLNHMSVQGVMVSNQILAVDVVVPSLLSAVGLVLIADRLIALVTSTLRASPASRWTALRSILLRLTAVCALAVPFLILSTIGLIAFTDSVFDASGCDSTQTMAADAWLDFGLVLSVALASLIVEHRCLKARPPTQEMATVF